MAYVLFGLSGSFIGVDFIDYRCVLGAKDAALELHGWRQFAGLLRPLLGHDAKSLDGFKFGQRYVYIAHNVAVEGDDAGMGCELGARGK